MANGPNNAPRSKALIGARVVVTLLACLGVLFVGIWAFSYLVNNPTTAERRVPEKTAWLVDTMTATVGDYPAMLSAMGETIPATEVQLKPQISGRIVSISPAFVPGGRFKAGQEILRIDPSDYELALAQRESEVLQAQSQIIAARAELTSAEQELSIEQGSQKVARREFELLGEKISEEDRALVLREPQLQAAQAAVESARAAIASAEAALDAAENRLAQAQLDLERTTVYAPFNAVVMEKNADIGDIVNTSTVLASLLGTDRIWVEIAVPMSDTRWIETGAHGETPSRVEIRNPSAWGNEVHRDARAIQVLPQIDTTSRMARVLVEVDDPLALSDQSGQLPMLLVGSYVHARVIGPTIRDVVRLPRAVVRDGDLVRIMNDSNELENRRVTIAFREPDSVLISEGIEAGEQIVTTNLSTAVDGLPLRTVDTPTTARSGSGTAEGGRE
ncbi:MAG: efflux RND transporter periplasmic adaptor subunit [Phycisphaerales bacterium JB065]